MLLLLLLTSGKEGEDERDEGRKKKDSRQRISKAKYSFLPIPRPVKVTIPLNQLLVEWTGRKIQENVFNGYSIEIFYYLRLELQIQAI